jgi:hypothetical protein
MNYYFESLLVGVYCSILYIILFGFEIKNTYIFLFIFGFLKHFFGYYLGIQNYFCKHCDNSNVIENENKKANIKPLLLHSILEGIYFLLIGSIGFIYFESNRYRIILFFIIGVLTHLIAEWIGIHKYFCSNICIII